jgi:hypothetical protein
MKKINFILLLLLTSLSSRAQLTEIVPLQNRDYPSRGDVYYKDVNNLLNPFVGTWVYTNGTTSFKIVLRKITNFNNGFNFMDLIVGEYEYIENGVTLINTLPNLFTTIPYKIPQSIDGDLLLPKYGFPPCNDCASNEYRLKMIMGDPLKDVGFDVIARRVWHNNQAALSIYFYCDGLKYSGTTMDDTTIESVGQTMPDGTFIFIKQP